MSVESLIQSLFSRQDDRPHWVTMFERSVFVLSEVNKRGLKRIDLDGHRKPTTLKTDLNTSNVLTVVHRQRQPDGGSLFCWTAALVDMFRVCLGFCVRG